MNIENRVALVTGANRGLGLAFARGLLARGAKKVYAAARDPSSIALAGVTPIAIDVTSEAQIAAAAEACGDVELLINNAGISRISGLLEAGTLANLRAELETNLFGPLLMSRAFAPTLARNGGGAIVNVLSVLSWLSAPRLATYSVSKSAAWSLTNGLRAELRAQGTQVLALHVGFIDTDMASQHAGAKVRPEDVAESTLSGLEAGALEVLADGLAQQIKRGLSADHATYLGEPR